MKDALPTKAIVLFFLLGHLRRNAEGLAHVLSGTINALNATDKANDRRLLTGLAPYGIGDESRLKDDSMFEIFLSELGAAESDGHSDPSFI